MMLVTLILTLVTLTCTVVGQQEGGELRYDYRQVLNMSLLFYEAQRSGFLPRDNRVPWRGDSCVNDRGRGGEDISGGYFTQGITLQFMFPNAAATTVLAWGAVNYQDAYKAAGLTKRVREAVKWGADHIVKCHTSPNELYVLVGDVHRETALFWGRPEDLDYQRPAQSITTTKPGSEVAAEAAAALAASSLLLPADKESYLEHARQLYEFSTRWRGDYHFSVPDVTPYYKSWSGDEDELVWAAIWLYRATREDKYLVDAENMYRRFNMRNAEPREFSWDQKIPAVKLLLFQMTQKESYKNDAKKFCDMVSNESFSRSPKGLFIFDGQDIGALRYSSNAAYVCNDLGETLVTQGEIDYNHYISFTIKQIHYALGSTGRSYLVGFGANYPRFPYHSAASCPARGEPCGWSNFNSTQENPHEVLGALVGGPDARDEYADVRHWRQNGVAVDHNSGFQSAVAGLLSMHEQGRLPSMAYVEQ